MVTVGLIGDTLKYKHQYHSTERYTKYYTTNIN